MYVHHYNESRLHSAIGYVTPRDKLEGREKKIFQQRDKKLEVARERRMKKGKGQVVGWTLELAWSNGVVEKHGECDDTCASEVDNYLTELERERNE